MNRFLRCLAIIFILIFSTFMITAIAEGNTTIQISEIFQSRNLVPFDIGLIVEGLDVDSELYGFLDLFPLDANYGEHTEATEDYWAFYDAVMALTLVKSDLSTLDTPAYSLKFVVGDNFESIVFTFYKLTNIVDVCAQKEGKKSDTQRYIAVDRILLQEIFRDMQAYEAYFSSFDD